MNTAPTERSPSLVPALVFALVMFALALFAAKDDLRFPGGPQELGPDILAP